MDHDDDVSKPPPLPPGAKSAGRKRSFWRTPIGVLAAVGLSFGVLIFVALAVYGVAMGTGHVPDSAVVAGDKLPSRVVALLHDHEIVEADERVHYYYSAGLFDHLSDGHLISDERVVWFWKIDGTVDQFWLVYDQIADIRVAWGSGLLDDTVITIVDKDDDEAEIYVPTEDGGDRKYYQQLRKLWQLHR